LELTLKLSKEVFTQPFYFIKASNSGKILALSDNVKFIYIMNAETKEMINENFVNHNGKIFDLSFNHDDSILLSCSLDRSAFLWDIAAKSKLIRYDLIDKESCNSATWLKDNCFAVGGSTGIINKVTFNK
jgi:WD40 repeat protein